MIDRDKGRRRKGGTERGSAFIEMGSFSGTKHTLVRAARRSASMAAVLVGTRIADPVVAVVMIIPYCGQQVPRESVIRQSHYQPTLHLHRYSASYRAKSEPLPRITLVRRDG